MRQEITESLHQVTGLAVANEGHDHENAQERPTKSDAGGEHCLAPQVANPHIAGEGEGKEDRVFLERQDREGGDHRKPPSIGGDCPGSEEDREPNHYLQMEVEGHRPVKVWIGEIGDDRGGCDRRVQTELSGEEEKRHRRECADHRLGNHQEVRPRAEPVGGDVGDENRLQVLTGKVVGNERRIEPAPTRRVENDLVEEGEIERIGLERIPTQRRDAEKRGHRDRNAEERPGEPCEFLAREA